jgi:hypothetical protein
LELGVERFNAFNIKEDGKQVVMVYVEGNKELEEFQRFAKERFPKHAAVSRADFEEFDGYIMGIDQHLHLTQVEQLHIGIPAILDIRENTYKMLEKQDETIKEIKTARKELKEETRGLRGDLKSYLDERFVKIEREIAEIKAKVGLAS